MKQLRDLSGACLSAALLAACGGNDLSSAPAGIAPRVASSAASATSRPLKPLHVFEGGKDGAAGQAALVKMGGTLYGTTLFGGVAKNCNPSPDGGCGTIFKVDPSGQGYDVLYRFKGGTDGAIPQANLIDVGGVLYGTTTNGG